MKGRQAVLNIVSFAVPYPPLYGGVIDVFYRLKALKELGVQVHLHCFFYTGSEPSVDLEQYCESVTYYKRKTSIFKHVGRMPYIMSSRYSRALVENLSRSEGPILFEGIHTCGVMDAPQLVDRVKYIRMHNVEWEYYLLLSQTSGVWWKKMYFSRESKKLRRGERRVVKHADGLFAISQNDYDYFAKLHANVTLLLPFHQYREIMVLPGEGDFVLLQGDLRVEDNFRSVLKLARLCDRLGIPCKIAGRAPDTKEITTLNDLANIDLHLDVSEDEMMRLMQEAQIQVIHSSITSGFKLKLVSALFTARHIIARRILVSKPLREVVHTYSDTSEIASLLQPLMSLPVTREDIARRKTVLLPRFSNESNARLFLDTIESK